MEQINDTVKFTWRTSFPLPGISRATSVLYHTDEILLSERRALHVFFTVLWHIIQFYGLIIVKKGRTHWSAPAVICTFEENSCLAQLLILNDVLPRPDECGDRRDQLHHRKRQPDAIDAERPRERKQDRRHGDHAAQQRKTNPCTVLSDALKNAAVTMFTPANRKPVK